ncbi:MAG: hypothetical protein HY791_33740 [Deltaproteobacteria bacterium]|nr:hypothetical protein [Deltaproteobacteria bacterium]
MARRATYVLVLLGCGSTGGPETTGPIPGTCELGATGSGSAAISSTGDPTELASVSSTAQNTDLIDQLSPVGRPPLGAVRARPCGVLGTVLVRRLQASSELAYTSDGVLEKIGDTIRAGRPALLFDGLCRPLVLDLAREGLVEHVRTGEGTWTSTTVLPMPATGYDPRSAELGRDGKLHALAHSGALLIHGVRDPAEGALWTFTNAPQPPGATTVFEYSVDSKGRVHAVYTKTRFPCFETCDLSLNHALLEGTSWVETVLERGVWGPPLDELAVDPSLAIDASDRPVVAAQFRTRVETGSLQSASLRVYTIRGSEVCAESVITESDGYAGSDGTNFTGSRPLVELDGTGRIFVVFSDMSAWHDSMGQNLMAGQIRSAVRSDESWTLGRLVTQAGQSQSRRPLVFGEGAGLTIAADGSSGALVTVEGEWDNDSVYNVESSPVAIRVLRRELGFGD